MKSVYLSRYDGFIRYFDLPGSSPVRIYLPGLATSAVAFMDTVHSENLRSHRSIIVDYFGSGMSDAPRDLEYTLEQHVDMVMAVLIQEELTTVEVVGHSMGGTIGIQLAVEYPGLVSKLVVCEANIGPGGGVTTANIVRMGRKEYENKARTDFFEKLKQRAIQNDQTAKFLLTVSKHSIIDALFQGAEMLVNLSPDFRENFLSLPIPRTFVYGEKNHPSQTGVIWPDIPEMKELQQHGIETAVVPNSGHLMMVDNLVEFTTIISNALR